MRYIAGLTASDRHQKAIVESLAPQGALALIDDPKTFDIAPFKSKSQSVHWEFMFTRSMFETADMIEQKHLLTRLAGLADEQRIRTTMTEAIHDF